MKNLFKYILVLLLFFVMISGTCFAKTIRFAQLTDVHFSTGNEFKADVLKAAIDDINKQPDLDFVVFTGDNIDVAKESELVEFMKFAKKLHKPYYIVIGNHDVFKSNGLSKDRYLEIVKGNKFWKLPLKPSYVFKRKGFVFIVVDGAKEVIPGPNGYYKKETLDWLNIQLTKNAKSPVVIFQHFPLVEPRRVKSHVTYKAQEYLDLLHKHDNVISVISGHYHVNNEVMQEGIYHISTPTLLNEPYSYKIIDIVTTPDLSPMIYTQLREVSPKKD